MNAVRTIQDRHFLGSIRTITILKSSKRFSSNGQALTDHTLFIQVHPMDMNKTQKYTIIMQCFCNKL